ncbi:hypothetical protein FACS1894178_6750 [Bacteroidia bacterium]|nr:hypothetical protein FACS1894178_6750 [Bacteroidia bacterium]
MKNCVKCKKEIKCGCYNTPIGVFCVDCYTDEDAINAIKIAIEQMRAKNEILAEQLNITLPKAQYDYE